MNLQSDMSPQFRNLSLLSLALATAVLSPQGLLAQAESWTTPVSISNHQRYPERPAIALGRDGRVFVVWDSAMVKLFYAEFDGHDWLPPIALNDSGTVCWDQDIAVDSLGNPHVVWMGGTLDSLASMYRYFDGAIWSTPFRLTSSFGDPRICIDRRGGIHVVMHGGYGVAYMHYYGSQWSAPAIISASIDGAMWPRLAVDAKNNPHVTFFCYDTVMTSTTVIYYRGQNDGVWSPVVRLTHDSLESNYPDIALGANNLPVIVWEHHFNPWPIVKLEVSQFDGASWDQSVVPVDTSESYNASITIDKAGTVHLVWDLWYRAIQQARVLYSDNADGAWTPPVDISGNSGMTVNVEASIKVDDQGTCHVVWRADSVAGYNSVTSILYSRRSFTLGVSGRNGTLPGTTYLDQNYPNPFNPSTTIRYALPSKAHMTLTVFNTLGQQVATLVNETQDAGYHDVRFDGSGFASGVYFYRLRAGEYVSTKKLVLLK